MIPNYLAVILLLVASQVQAFVPASFSVHYDMTEETYTGKDNKNSGTIDYQFPKHLKIETSTPFKSLLVINPDKAIKYEPDFSNEKLPGQMIESNNPGGHLTSLLDSLKDGIKGNEFFTVKAGKKIVLEVKPTKQAELDAKEIILKTKSENKPKSLKQVSQIIFIKVNGRKKMYQLKDFKEIKFPAKFFEFTPPVGTKIKKL